MKYEAKKEYYTRKLRANVKKLTDITQTLRYKPVPYFDQNYDDPEEDISLIGANTNQSLLNLNSKLDKKWGEMLQRKISL